MTSLTRRSLLQLYTLAAVGGAAGLSRRLRSDATPRRLLRTPVQVPADFLGMHFHRWPQGQPLSPAPTYRYGAVRSHDYSGPGDGISWAAIHLGENTYRWAAMDSWVAAHTRSPRKTLVYTVYGTPAWLARSTAHTDAYGRAGAGEPPRELAPLAAFITALVSRYNSPYGRRSIHWIEIWNEPHFANSYADFWWGSAPELAAMGRSIYQAARAADPGIRILSPGFDANLTGALTLDAPSLHAAQASSLLQYLTAADGAGATGSRWCDAVAFHTYEADLSDAANGTEAAFKRLESLLALLRLRLPIYCTECGFRPGSAFALASDRERATTLRRLAALFAALQLQGLYFYAHDDNFIGDPARNPLVAQALDDIGNHLAGRTVQQLTLLASGAMTLETDRLRFTW